MNERREEIAVTDEGGREGGGRSKEPVIEGVSVNEVAMGLPGRGSVVAPVDEVSEVMGGAGALGGDPVESILRRGAEGEGPGIVMGISGGDGTVREGEADTAANREAEVDTWGEVGVGGVDSPGGGRVGRPWGQVAVALGCARADGADLLRLGGEPRAAEAPQGRDPARDDRGRDAEQDEGDGERVDQVVPVEDVPGSGVDREE